MENQPREASGITGIVNKIIKFSYVDGPGNRAAVFLQGCNMNCRYCHNPETINLCSGCAVCISSCAARALSKPRDALLYDSAACVGCDACIAACPYQSSPKARRMSAAEVFEEIGEAAAFVSGITVSGGECTLQSEFVTGLFKIAKGMGLSTFIDSNGMCDFSREQALLGVTDAVMMDVKVWGAQEHLLLTGQPNDAVLRNIPFLGATGKLYEIRTVIFEGFIDFRETVAMASRAVSGFDVRYKLIKYRAHGVRSEFAQSLSEPSDRLMEELRQIAQSSGAGSVIVQ